MFIGEVTQGQATTIVLPNTTLRSVSARAKTTDYIVTPLDELGTYGLPPPAVDDPEANHLTLVH
jgi:hypothetical protein